MGRIIQFVNPVMALSLGYASPDDLCGSDMRTLLAPLSMPPGKDIARLFAGSCCPATSHRTRHTSGSWRALAGGCLSAVSWQGMPAMLVTCLDVTARHHLETQVRQSHTMHRLGALAGGIAHDFNICSRLFGLHRLVMDDVPRESLAWHRLQRVLTAGERAKRPVRQILTVSRQQEQERVLYAPSY